MIFRKGLRFGVYAFKATTTSVTQSVRPAPKSTYAETWTAKATEIAVEPKSLTGFRCATPARTMTSTNMTGSRVSVRTATDVVRRQMAPAAAMAPMYRLAIRCLFMSSSSVHETPATAARSERAGGERLRGLPGHVLPADVLPGHVHPAEALPADVLPGDVVPGHVLPGHVLPADARRVDAAVVRRIAPDEGLTDEVREHVGRERVGDTEQAVVLRRIDGAHRARDIKHSRALVRGARRRDRRRGRAEVVLHLLGVEGRVPLERERDRAGDDRRGHRCPRQAEVVGGGAVRRGHLPFRVELIERTPRRAKADHLAARCHEVGLRGTIGGRTTRRERRRRVVRRGPRGLVVAPGRGDYA